MDDGKHNISMNPSGLTNTYLTNNLTQTNLSVPNFENTKGSFHLVKDDYNLRGNTANKQTAERTFAPILHTKNKVQFETNNLFDAILTTDARKSSYSGEVFSGEIPLCIRFLFQFFEEVRSNHNLSQETLHIWKSNSLILRFWMDIISEPTTLLDVDDLVPVQASMRVVATALMESCSTSSYNYSVDTPVNKLLFAKDVVNNWNSSIRNYFIKITDFTSRQPFDYHSSLLQFTDSMEAHADCFNRQAAAGELLTYSALKNESEFLKLSF